MALDNICDAIVGPCLGSCALGLINTLISLGIQISQPWNALNITALGLSAISTIAYTLASAYTYRRISTVRNLDGHRLRQSTSDEDRAVLLPEDELQRQQLLRLLLKRDSDRAPSPEVNKNTFRIDLPTPSSSYSRVQGYLAAPFQNEMRSTSGSSTQPGLFQWTTEAREYYQPSSRDFTFQDIEMDERRGYHVRANSNRV
ncbi:MAG: hypothetical protein M1834_000116 [Cirrosporium novae-zelandiae]|nr:MAG: hypothetical protein M1834_000116 [Cirrosporium novae-zelandiae]